MSTSNPSLKKPTYSDLRYTLGIQSSLYWELMPRLADLFTQVENQPDIAATFQQWQYFAALVYGSDSASHPGVDDTVDDNSVSDRDSPPIKSS